MAVLRKLAGFVLFGSLALSSAAQATTGSKNLLREALLPAFVSIRVSRLPVGPRVPEGYGVKPILNELCRNARLTAVEFVLVDTVAKNRNYCALPSGELPIDVRGAIEKIGEIHAKIADAVGIPEEELFGPGYRVTFRGFDGGSLASQSDAQGVTLTVLPDWTLADFPSMVYAHEIIHTLAFNPGPIQALENGIQDHPLIFEALPDLISAFVHDSPVIRLGETRLDPALRDYRDATPPRSFDESFRTYYRYANVDSLTRRCRELDLKKENALVDRLCRAAEEALRGGLADWAAKSEERGVKAPPLDTQALEAPFRASECLSKTRSGLLLPDRCDGHQFSFPLVSFFFRLKELTGRHLLREFIAALRASEKAAPTYVCRYAKGTETLGGVPAELKVRSILGAFLDLREGLTASERPLFDRAWNESGFSRFVDLDRLYRIELFPLQARLAAAAKNPEFAKANGCSRDDLYRLDPNRCAVKCERREARGLTP